MFNMFPRSCLSLLCLMLFVQRLIGQVASDPMLCMGKSLDTKVPPLPPDHQTRVQAACRGANGLSGTTDPQKIDRDWDTAKRKPLNGFFHSYKGWSTHAMPSNNWTRCSHRFGTLGNQDGEFGNLIAHCESAQGALNHQKGGRNMGRTLLYYDSFSIPVPLDKEN